MPRRHILLIPRNLLRDQVSVDEAWRRRCWVIRSLSSRIARRLESGWHSFWGQEQVTDTSLFIVLCADLRAWEKQPGRYWVNAPQEVQDFMLPAIDDYYHGKDQVQRDEAMRSCGVDAQTLMLTAKSMGYDSCPMDGFDFEKVAGLIHLPDDHVIAMFVAIGKGTKEAWPRPGQLEPDNVIIKNRFA